MATKPILFNTDMVRAILEGRKSETRRLVHKDLCPGEGETWTIMPPKVKGGAWGIKVSTEDCDYACLITPIKPRYEVGDILWVRETFTKLWVDTDIYKHYDQPMYYYAADGDPDITLVDGDGFEEDDQRIRWRPSIHMPREAARIFICITGVKLEWLNDITEEGAMREGAYKGRLVTEDGETYFLYRPNDGTYMAGFQYIWGSTIKPADQSKYGWHANPLVWVYTYERIEKPVNF